MRIIDCSRGLAAAAVLTVAFVLTGSGRAPAKPTAWRLESLDLQVKIVPGPGKLRGEARLTLAASGSGTEAIGLALNDELEVSSVSKAPRIRSYVARPAAIKASSKSLTSEKA